MVGWGAASKSKAGGDRSVKELVVKIGNGLREMKLVTVIDNTQITINALPVIAPPPALQHSL